MISESLHIDPEFRLDNGQQYMPYVYYGRTNVDCQ